MIGQLFKRFTRFVYDRPFPLQHCILNRYRILSILGMGSYGITYKAYDTYTKTNVAVKQLRKTKAWLSRHRQAFHEEYVLLQALPSTPSFPSVYEKHSGKDGHFIIMELMEGRTFEDLIFHDQQTFTEEETVNIVLELLSLIEMIHKQGILHRDLRLPNILNRNGDLRVIDFGLAVFLSAKKQQKVTKDLMRANNISSDFYSLGHFALFLLYSNFEPTSATEESWEKELQLTPIVHHVLRKLLQIDPPYTTSNELRIDLQHYEKKQREKN